MKRGKQKFSPILPTPVEEALKNGPRGNGNWPGFDVVYRRIARGCQKMAQNKSTYLSQDHIDAMADLGSGHEERMKARLHWMYMYNYTHPEENDH